MCVCVYVWYFGGVPRGQVGAETISAGCFFLGAIPLKHRAIFTTTTSALLTLGSQLILLWNVWTCAHVCTCLHVASERLHACLSRAAEQLLWRKAAIVYLAGSHQTISYVKFMCERKETECSKPLYNAYCSCIGACFFCGYSDSCERRTTRAYNDATAQLHYVSMLCCIDVKWDGRLCFTSSCNLRWQLPDTSFDCYCTVGLSSYWFILILIQTHISINPQLQNRNSLMNINRPVT